MGFCSELDLEDLRVNGHHYIETPDGKMDDYDIALSEYIAKCKGDKSECVDSNGSEALEILGSLDDLTVKYNICEHEFESGLIIDGDFVAHGFLVKENGNVVFKIKNVEGYSIKTKKESKMKESDIADRW